MNKKNLNIDNIDQMIDFFKKIDIARDGNKEKKSLSTEELKKIAYTDSNMLKELFIINPITEEYSEILDENDREKPWVNIVNVNGEEVCSVKKDLINLNVKEYIKCLNDMDKGKFPKVPRFKKKRFEKILGLIEKNMEIAAYKQRDIITSDFSFRGKIILDVLSEEGTKKEPFMKKYKNIEVSKHGLKCSKSDIALFHYLLGEVEEHGGTTEITFYRADLLNAMDLSSARGSKFENIKSSLATIGTQFIRINENNSEDKVGKKLNKILSKKAFGTQLMQVSFLEDERGLTVNFKIPLMPYFSQQKQFGRIISRNIVKEITKNPRVYFIALELAKLLFISNQKNKRNISKIEINMETLIKNIGEWDRYINYSDKNKYLSRLNKDIEKAINSIKKDIKGQLCKCTPKTLKNGKVTLLKG